MYGKQTEYAISVMSRLAEVYDEGQTNVSADDIADYRGFPKPFVKKILSTLAHAGLVVGSRGPGGGCSLAKDPATIKLHDVFTLFERSDENDRCPFGNGRCGKDAPCPLHDKLSEVQDAMDRLLHETTFDVFQEAPQNKTTPSKSRKGKSTRSAKGK